MRTFRGLWLSTVVLAWLALPTGPLTAADKTKEEAAISKIQALGGRIIRHNAMGGRLSGPRSQTQPPAAQKPADNAVAIVAFVGNEKLTDDDL